MYMKTFCMLNYILWLINCMSICNLITELKFFVKCFVAEVQEIQACINLLLYQDLNIQHSQQFVVFIAMLLWVDTVSIPALNCSEDSFFGSLYPFLCAYILFIFVWSKGHWQPVSITFWVWLCNVFFLPISLEFIGRLPVRFQDCIKRRLNGSK